MAFARNGPAEIFYETFGDPGAETLVLVNGLGSQCINYRKEWCDLFVAKGLHVVRLDNRDVGLSTHFSDAPPGEAAYTLSEMAADVIAVLDALGVDRAHVMGLSMGGMIVQMLAIEHPDRLRSVTSVMSTTGEPDVGRSTEEAQARLFGPPATDRASAIANHLEGLRIWGSPGKVDEQAQAEYAARGVRSRLRSSRCRTPDRSGDGEWLTRRRAARGKGPDTCAARQRGHAPRPERWPANCSSSYPARASS